MPQLVIIGLIWVGEVWLSVVLFRLGAVVVWLCVLGVVWLGVMVVWLGVVFVRLAELVVMQDVVFVWLDLVAMLVWLRGVEVV